MEGFCDFQEKDPPPPPFVDHALLPFGRQPTPTNNSAAFLSAFCSNVAAKELMTEMARYKETNELVLNAMKVQRCGAGGHPVFPRHKTFRMQHSTQLPPPPPPPPPLAASDPVDAFMTPNPVIPAGSTSAPSGTARSSRSSRSSLDGLPTTTGTRRMRWRSGGTVGDPSPNEPPF